MLFTSTLTPLEDLLTFHYMELFYDILCKSAEGTSSLHNCWNLILKKSPTLNSPATSTFTTLWNNNVLPNVIAHEANIVYYFWGNLRLRLNKVQSKEIIIAIHHRVCHDSMSASSRQTCLDDGIAAVNMHNWNDSIQQVHLACSYRYALKITCLVMSRDHFIAWWTCRSQLVRNSILELLDFVLDEF